MSSIIDHDSTFHPPPFVLRLNLQVSFVCKFTQNRQVACLFACWMVCRNLLTLFQRYPHFALTPSLSFC